MTFMIGGWWSGWWSECWWWTGGDGVDGGVGAVGGGVGNIVICAFRFSFFFDPFWSKSSK